MPQELTLEQLAEKLDSVSKIASKIQTAMDEKEHEKKEAKKAMEEKKEEERKEALKAKRASRDAAIKKAMEEPDDEKKDAAIKKAMDDYDEEHKAMHEEHEKKEAMSDEEKEKNAQIASIIEKEKLTIDNKILAAAKIMNPESVKVLEEKLSQNSFTASKKMYDDMTLIYGEELMNPSGTHFPASSIENQQPVPYFMANAMNPADVDKAQLNANSPDSAFAKFSTEELLKMSEGN